ncbi:MAG: pterin-binding protein [Anaerolineales bacterium]|nr:MAG: pterin-binding protein [Anaerolineales bacterium]
MQTKLAGRRKTHIIDTEGPGTLIGEKINPTGNKKLSAALQADDYEFVRQLAMDQVAAGADILDVNVGVPGFDEPQLMKTIVQIMAETVEVPLCLDSPNFEALKAALPLAPGRPLVNSVNAEETSLEKILPLIKERDCAVIGLTIDENGIPKDVDTRLRLAGKILERAARFGIGAEDVIIDPLVLAVSTDHETASITLQAIERIRAEFGVSINLGASNVSFGLPERHTLNQSFLALAVAAGANCLISDPFKLSMTLRATDLLLGRDPFSARYIGHFRAMQGTKS